MQDMVNIEPYGLDRKILRPSSKVDDMTNSRSKVEKESVDSEGTTWSGEWKTFVEGVAISGAKFIADGKLPAVRRLVWTFLVLVGFGLMSYQLIERVVYFYTYPTNTIYGRKYLTTMNFPTVTLCSENRISLSRATAAGFYKFYTTTYVPYRDPTLPGPTPDFSEFNNTSIDWRQMYYNISNNYEYSMILCNFNGRNCNDRSDWTHKWTEMGLCMQFNKDGTHVVKQPGANYGLFVILEADQDDYAHVNLFGGGYRILLHEPGIYPDMVNKGTRLSIGLLTDIAVARTEVNLLPPRYGKCDPNAKLKYIADYSVDSCYFQCRMEYVMDQCGCIPFPYLDYLDGGLPVCSELDQAICIYPMYAEYVTKGISSNCTCPLACKDVTYSYQTTVQGVSSFLTNYLEPNLNPTAPPGWFTQKYLSVSVYLPTLSYVDITQEKDYDIFTLFCDMGGALGLLLGSTFLTLYEFVDFAIFTAIKIYRR